MPARLALILKRGSLFLAASLLLSVLATGCNPGKQYQFHAVKGRVLRGEEPVSGGTIRFTNPEDPNLVATSPIGADGTFVLQSSTTQPARTSAGAPVGQYQVVVSMPAEQPNRPFPSLTAPEMYTVAPGANDLTVKLP
jgi:hypothetical protein